MWSRCLCRCQCAGVWLDQGRGIDPRCGVGVCADVSVLGYGLTREGALTLEPATVEADSLLFGH